jgi:hypothetical protein
MNLCPNHIRCLWIGDHELRVGGAKGCIEEGFIVVDFHGLAEETFGDIRCFVVFFVGCLSECCGGCSGLNRTEVGTCGILEVL